MNKRLKRALVGVTALAVTLVGAPLFSASPAHAAGTLQGPATIKTAGGAANLQSGDSDDTWTLRLPGGAACEGDGVAGYTWRTYFVPSSVDETALTFDAFGPAGAGNKPLYDTGGNPINSGDLSPGDGTIINIPNMYFGVFTPGDIPAGVYDLGIACTNPSGAMTRFWNVQMTVATNAAGDTGPADITWQNGTVPAAPTGVSAAPGNGSATVSFTPSANPNPAVTQYTVTATPSGGGTPVTATGASSPITVTGLTNLTTYSVTVRATNAVGNSPESSPAASVTPGAAAVTGLSAEGLPNAVKLTWTGGSSPFTIDYCTAPGANSQCDTGEAGFTQVTGVAGSPHTISSLTPGTTYTFTVYYAGSSKASTTGTPISDAILIQDVSVTRPNGALVLTQVCGRFGALPSEPASTGFPAGFGAETATTGGTAPTLDGGGADPNFGQYPTVANPNYPTHCSLNLGTAQLVTSGTGAGKFYAASGRLNQVSVSDTREEDDIWTVNFQMTDFSAGPGKTFSGNQLGWTNTSVDNAPFTNGSGATYDQTVANDPPVAPNTVGGAGTSHAVAHCAADNSCLGVTTIDARIKVLIPVNARNGLYTGQLRITAV